LTENAAESIHGRILLVGVFAFTNLMRWIRPSFQIPNLDKSDSDVPSESLLAGTICRERNCESTGLRPPDRKLAG